MAATPFVVVFLILLGYSVPIGQSLHHQFFSKQFSELGVILVVLGIFMVAFQFFNSFITSIYYYLFNDVVPRAFLARMMALFRSVSSPVGHLLQVGDFSPLGRHTPEILLGVALLYLVGFVLMCWKVKEGGYPPPEDLGPNPGVLSAIKAYAQDCFTHRFYWLIFLANSSWALLGDRALHGPREPERPWLHPRVCRRPERDRWRDQHRAALSSGHSRGSLSPLRVVLVALAFGLLLAPIGMILPFIRPHLSLATSQDISIFAAALGLPMNTLYLASEAALFMRLFPQDRYGQFCSANAMVRAIALIIGGTVVGTFLDEMKVLDLAHPDLCYRFVPIWNFVFQSGYVFFYYLVYPRVEEARRPEELRPAGSQAPV